MSTSELRLAGEPPIVTKLDASMRARGISDAMSTDLTRSLASKGQREIALAIDADVPYRIVGDVLFACTQARIGKFHFVVGRDGGLGEIFVELSGPDRVLLIGTDEGIVIKTRGGNVARGCTDVGSGVAVPNANGTVDAPALESCLKFVFTALPNASGATFMPTWDAPYAQLVAVFDAERIAGFKSIALSNRAR